MVFQCRASYELSIDISTLSIRVANTQYEKNYLPQRDLPFFLRFSVFKPRSKKLLDNAVRYRRHLSLHFLVSVAREEFSSDSRSRGVDSSSTSRWTQWLRENQVAKKKRSKRKSMRDRKKEREKEESTGKTSEKTSVLERSGNGGEGLRGREVGGVSRCECTSCICR